MEKKHAINWMKVVKENYEKMFGKNNAGEIREALDMAMKALEVYAPPVAKEKKTEEEVYKELSTAVSELERNNYSRERRGNEM